MNDLISRADAINALDCGICTRRLIELPSADAVPVVRCRDCRWGRETCGNIECGGEYHGFDWYCPNGKRKEE